MRPAAGVVAVGVAAGEVIFPFSVVEAVFAGGRTAAWRAVVVRPLAAKFTAGLWRVSVLEVLER